MIEGTLFDATLTTPPHLASGFRVFTKPEQQTILPAFREYQPEPIADTLTTHIAEFSSGRHTEAAQLCGSLWFADDNPRNSHLNLPLNLHFQAAGELAAILQAARSSPSLANLHIICPTPYTILCITKYLRTWEN